VPTLIDEGAASAADSYPAKFARGFMGATVVWVQTLIIQAAPSGAAVGL